MFFKRLFLISILSICSSFHGQSQWIPSQGLEGAVITEVLIYDSLLFITGNGNGIFRKHINDPQWNLDHYPGGFSRIRRTDTVIFANSSWKNDFSRSFDAGENWEEIESPYNIVRSMEIIGNTLFISHLGEIYLSNDNGDSWSLIKKQTTNFYADLMFSNDSVLFCLNEIMDSVFISEDLGSSWSTISLTSQSGNLNLYGGIFDIFKYQNVLFAGSYLGIFYYDESSDNWIEFNDSINTSIYISAYVHSFIDINENLYCCTSTGFYQLNNQDSCWISQNDGLDNPYTYSAYLQNNIVYLATASGPYYRRNDSSWIADNYSLFQLNIQQIIINNDTIYALANDKMYFSLEPYTDFEVLETNWICNPQYIMATDSLWYAGSDSGFLISDNSGYSWENHYTGLFRKRVNDVSANQEHYFASSSGLFRAHKDTLIWRRVPNWIGDANVYYVCTLDSVLFATVYCEGVYRSVDNGKSFQLIPESSKTTSRLTVVGNNIYMYQYNQVYYSCDLGLTWEVYKEVGNDIRIRSMDVVDETSVIGASFNPYTVGEVLVTLHSPLYPNGLVINDNLPVNSWPLVNDIKIIDDMILISTNYNSIWYRNDLSVAVPETPLISVQEDAFHIYPNPSSDYITFQFLTIPSASLRTGNFQSSIAIYNLFGRKMDRIDIQQDQKKIHLNISSYPQGIYIAVVRDAIGIVDRKKFLVTR